MSDRIWTPDPRWLSTEFVKRAGGDVGVIKKFKDTGTGFKLTCPYCRNQPDQQSNTKDYTLCASLYWGRDTYWFRCFNCHIGQAGEGVSLRKFLKRHFPGLYVEFNSRAKLEKADVAAPSRAESKVKASNGRMRERFAKTKGDPDVARSDQKMDDEDVAGMFIKEHGERFRYDPTWTKSKDEKGLWLNFDGARWQPDTGNTVGELVGAFTRTDARVGSAIRRMKTKHAIQQTTWDTRPELIAFTNGVYDLKADAFRKGKAEDFVTRACAAAYNAKATAPRWTRFLDEVFEPTPEVIPFLQELLGYMFTGFTDPHHVTFFHGAGGRNGKSTLCKLLSRICKDYTWSFNAQRIFGHKTPDIPNDIADFKGYRFVYSNELPKQVKLTSTLVKLLSGGDDIVARQLFATNQNIPPTWHMVIVANHVPVFDDDGDALWDRVLCVPFNVRFEGAKQDRNLDATLLSEAEGILAWIVEGARRYMKNGRRFTTIPDAVKAAGESMRDLSRSSIDAFFHERLERDKNAETPVKEIWSAYEQWLTESDAPVVERLTMTKLGRELTERFRKVLDKRMRTVIYAGVRLKGLPQPSAEHAEMVKRRCETPEAPVREG